MYTFEHSVHIERPVREVWDFVSDITNHPKFGPMEVAEWTSDSPPGVGATTRTVTRFLGRTLEAKGEITAWEPPQQYSTTAQFGSMASRGQWRFEEQANGTLLTFSGQADIGGFFKIAESLVGKQIDKQITTDLSSLKLMLEAGIAESEGISA